MSIYIINSDNFTITNKTLCVKHSGVMVILYYSMTCQYCHGAMEVLEKLAPSMPNVTFGIFNIGENLEIASASQETSTPIQYVPITILYVNGTPHVQFNGDEDVQTLRNTILSVINDIQQPSQQSSQQQPQKPTVVPVKGKRTKRQCYLSFNKLPSNS